MVTGLVMMFALTAGGVIWLARDVDRSISHRSSAQSIAFQAARSGAQQVDVVAIRGGAIAPIPLDPAAARAVAHRTADDLFDSYGLDGTVVAIDVAGAQISVTVEIHDGGRTVTGAGSARSESGP